MVTMRLVATMRAATTAISGTEVHLSVVSQDLRAVCNNSVPCGASWALKSEDPARVAGALLREPAADSTFKGPLRYRPLSIA
jgi:hypothetical protein